MESKCQAVLLRVERHTFESTVAPAWELFTKLNLPSHAITPSWVLCWSVQLELHVSKRLGTFVTWEVRVKEQQKLWILCWFVCLAMQRWIFQELADWPVPDKGSEKNWMMRFFGCSRKRPPPLCCEFSYFRRTNCNNGSMHVCSLSPFGRVLLSSRKVGPHFTGRTNPFTLNLWTVGGK